MMIFFNVHELPGLVQGPLAGCQYGNVPVGFLKGRVFLDCLNDCKTYERLCSMKSVTYFMNCVFKLYLSKTFYHRISCAVLVKTLSSLQILRYS